MKRIAALGEMLVDFVSTQPGAPLTESPAFEPAAGGAPANVAVGAARLGCDSSFLGKTGLDPWGRFLAKALQDNGVDVRGLRFTDKARTALAFISLQEDGERDFVFYRHPSADMLYAPADVDMGVMSEATLLHCGSICLNNEPSRLAMQHAVYVARQRHILISYDPNVRLELWPDEATARTTMRDFILQANIVKMSEEELWFLSQDDNMHHAVLQLWHPNLHLLAVTQGAAGCSYFTAEARGTVPGFRVQTVDTTGAGDGWMAALLVQLTRTTELWRDIVLLEAALRYANAAGALTTTRRGAIPALPTEAQVGEVMANALGA